MCFQARRRDLTYRNIQKRDARPEFTIRLVLIHKCMLSPISNHQSRPQQHEWRHKHKDRGRCSPSRQQGDTTQICDLPSQTLARERIASFTIEIPGQIEPDEEEEASEVVQEMPHIIPLTSNRGREVVWPITLHVMVLDVVVEIRVPSVPVKWIQDVWVRRVDKGVREAFGQYPTHVDVLVAHECVRAYVPGLHGEMQDGVGIGEVSVQEHGARHGCGEVKDEVRDHYHVCRIARYRLRPGDIGKEYLSRHFTHVPEIPRDKDGGFEFCIIWIVHGVDGLQCCIAVPRDVFPSRNIADVSAIDMPILVGVGSVSRAMVCWDGFLLLLVLSKVRQYQLIRRCKMGINGT